MAKKKIKTLKPNEVTEKGNPFEEGGPNVDMESLTQNNPLFDKMQALEFDNEIVGGVCMTLSLLYHDFNKKKRLSRLRAIILNVVELYPSDRAKVKTIFRKERKAKRTTNLPTVRHGAKKAKGNYGVNQPDCDDCPQVQGVKPKSSFKKVQMNPKSDEENLTFGPKKVDVEQATNTFLTLEDVYERFTEKGSDEPNVMAMKIYCNNEGIRLHPQASKASTIAKAIVAHYQNLANQSKKQSSEEE